jgi:hypothetical protein
MPPFSNKNNNILYQFQINNNFIFGYIFLLSFDSKHYRYQFLATKIFTYYMISIQICLMAYRNKITKKNNKKKHQIDCDDLLLSYG